MNKTIEFLINKKNNGERLDVFLSNEIKNLTRSYIKKLIEKNKVKLNKTINTSPSTKIKTNDEIIINIIEEQNLKLIPSKIKLDIVYEDKDLLIVNKPNIIENTKPIILDSVYNSMPREENNENNEYLEPVIRNTNYIEEAVYAEII